MRFPTAQKGFGGRLSCMHSPADGRLPLGVTRYFLMLAS